MSLIQKFRIQKFLIMINFFFISMGRNTKKFWDRWKRKRKCFFLKKKCKFGKMTSLVGWSYSPQWSLKGRVLLRPVCVTINSPQQVIPVNFCSMFCTEKSSAFRLLSCLSQQLVFKRSLFFFFTFFSCVLSWMLFLKKLIVLTPFPGHGEPLLGAPVIAIYIHSVFVDLHGLGLDTLSIVCLYSLTVLCIILYYAIYIECTNLKWCVNMTQIKL